MTRPRQLLPGLFALWLAGCSVDERAAGRPDGPTTDPARPWFREVALEAGIDFVHVAAHVRRYWMPEISPGGLALFDYDDDGDLDLYCVQSGDLEPARGHPREHNRLFEQRDELRFVDVTERAGVGDTGYGHGCATGDFDADGHVDLFVANVGPDVLYRNLGEGRFADVTARAGVAGEGWSTAVTFLDYDADGDLDLFVVQNLNWSPALERVCSSPHAERDYCNPKNYSAPSADRLHRNDGDGRFTDVSREVGLHAATGIGLGVMAADFDGDGRIDVYVANDSVPNVLWIQGADGKFTDQALVRGCAVNAQGASEASMGVQAVDVNGDGAWDLFMTHVREETNTFYLNRGGVFSDRTDGTGLGSSSRRFTGFGMGFADFDHDGHLDLFIANGRVDLSRPFYCDDAPYAEPNQLYRGLGEGRFEDVSALLSSPRLLGTSRAAAFGDLDGDGALDVVYQDLDGRVHVLWNQAPRAGRWLMLRLLDPRGVDALGAVARVRAGGRDHYRLCQMSYSYAAANDPRVHFGLGPVSALEAVEVTWPAGERESFGALELDRVHVLRQGTGRRVGQDGGTGPGGR